MGIEHEFKLRCINDWEEDLEIHYDSVTDAVCLTLSGGRGNIDKNIAIPRDIFEKVYKSLKYVGIFE